MELRQIERDRTRTRAFTRGRGSSTIGLCWVYVQTLVFRSYLKLNYSKPNLNCWMRSGTKDLTDHRERRSRTPQKEGKDEAGINRSIPTVEADSASRVLPLHSIPLASEFRSKPHPDHSL